MVEKSTCSLGDVATIVMGQSPKGTMCNRDGIGQPLLNGPTEFGPHHPVATQFTTDARKQSQPGDVLFCVRGSTTGRMNWSDRSYAIGRGIAAIRHKQTPRRQPLVRAAIENGLPALLQSATGSTFPNVAAHQLVGVPFPKLSENEQDQAASLLGALDDKIELNRQTNETLEALARAIFKDWFVDFGPTRAKAEGRAPYLVPALWDLFPDRLDAEGKPEGWQTGELKDVIEFNPRERLKKGTEAPYLDMASLPTSGSTTSDPVPRAYTSGMRFRNNDTLLARITPCLENGKAAFVQTLPAETLGWGSTEFIVMRAKSPVPSSWPYVLIRDDSFRAFAIQSMTGTSGRQRARTEALSSYPVTTPDDAIWKTLDGLISPFFEIIRSNGEESKTLAQTRDLLLPKLMSGEIRLRDAEKLVEEVA